jgi:hypothetical protein
MPARRFAAPWSAVRTGGGWCVLDADGRPLGYVYGRDDGGVGYDGLTMDEARQIANAVARRSIGPRIDADGASQC